jgi:N-acetylglucosaminyldiphosphoundecaprenol N-acetyl-beta-D-mannosaminyltransferase
MLHNRARLHAPLLVAVGAAFDFVAGTKVEAPRWMRRSGLEWLWRFFSEPRRLWRRVLVEGPQFMALVAWDAIRKKRGRQPSS